MTEQAVSKNKTDSQNASPFSVLKPFVFYATKSSFPLEMLEFVKVME